MKNVNFEDFPRLGFGIMRLPQTEGEENKIDEEAFREMLDTYMASGMNYFDTAYVYYGGNSEKLLKKHLVSRYDRESYYLASKLPFWSMTDKAQVEEMFNESLARCGVDYFDMYLLHSLNRKNFEKADKFGAYEFVKQLKKDGRARRIGFSFHDTPDVLEEILQKYTEMEFVQLQINYLDWEGPMQSDEFYRIARKYNKPIIIMEPVRGGALANLQPDAEKLFKDYAPEKSAASWALRFCSSLEGVAVTLSGMSNMQQMLDNINTLKELTPLTEDEREIIQKVRRKIVESRLVPCTGCRYCSDCPKSIDIAGQFTLYNDFVKTLETESTVSSKYSQFEAKADACIECGLCESVCPQKIEIIKTLKKVHQSMRYL